MRTQRLQQIVDYINKERMVSFTVLCEHFNTSGPTMRRDLKYLSDTGQVERVHGGARAITRLNGVQTSTYTLRKIRNVNEKKEIAQKAFTQIKNHEVILLDTSSTVYELAYLLAESDLELMVITNDIHIGSVLRDNANIELLVIGGLLCPKSFRTGGVFAETMLKQLHADKAFLGVDSLNCNEGGFINHLDEARVKQLMLRQSKERILLCDHTKFTANGLFPVFSVSSLSMIITDSGLDDEYYNSFRRYTHLKFVR